MIILTFHTTESYTDIALQNPQKAMDDFLGKLQETGEKPKLLLHSCCAPCSSYVLEYLSRYFTLSVYYYNPNIFPEAEFEKRSAEQVSFTKEFLKGTVPVIQTNFDSEHFYEQIKGLEQEPEGGARCRECFRLRLEKTALYAKQNGFEYFTTTLSISPHKNARLLNEVGLMVGNQVGIPYLCADFKKKNGYLRSCQISKDYKMYRQSYCGCVFSMRENVAKSSDYKK